MATEPTKRIQVDVPASWVPQIDASQEDENRPSRHNMVLRLIREGLDSRGWKSHTTVK